MDKHIVIDIILSDSDCPSILLVRNTPLVEYHPCKHNEAVGETLS